LPQAKEAIQVTVGKKSPPIINTAQNARDYAKQLKKIKRRNKAESSRREWIGEKEKKKIARVCHGDQAASEEGVKTVVIKIYKHRRNGGNKEG